MNENLPQLDNTLKTNSPESPNGSLRPSRSPFKDISNTKVSKAIVCGKETFPKSSDTSWSERTEVITKQCHENYVSYSQEVVDKMVNEAFVISE
ncbi:hypothetical protein Avbf_07476 [Armadillidium vulgare]|nr:hypothetical protein Avbf_07476 [Armadillidium vulgare]